MVEDNTPPMIGGQGDNGTVECPAIPVFTDPTSSDTCSSSSIVLDSDSSTAGCGGSYTRTKTWQAVDACGNTSGQVHQTIMVEDNTPASIGSQGDNGTVECPATPVFTDPTSSDTCSSSSIVLDSDSSTAGCGGSYTRTKTWHAIDACGNTSGTVSQTIMVEDNTPPTIGGQGDNGTVECPATPVFTDPTSSDTCSSSSIVLDSDSSTAGCGGSYTRTKTWHAIDACGNTSGQVHQTIMVEDNTPPMIGGQGDNGTVECPATPVFTDPTSSDTCSSSSIVLDSDSSTAGCGGSYTRTKTWHAIDACGNTSGTVHQTIMVEDNTAPTISQPADGTVECPAMPVFTDPTSSDTCSSSSIVLDSDSSTAGCGGSYTRTKIWHAIDACGNTSGPVHQTIMVEDNTAPTISQPADGTVECPAMPVFTDPTSSDTCSSSSIVLDSDSSTAGCGGSYTRTKTWHAIDACGNTSAQIHQTIMVVDDQPPTIGGQGSNNTVECPASPSFTAPTVSDTCSGATVQNLGDTTSGNSCALVTTRSWRAVDACGNTSATVSQHITRVDTTGPTIGGAGADATIACSGTRHGNPPTAAADTG